ncbi:hypothetical protein [Xylophilus sp. GOD-11R]|uniref:hypothetical protein n=1 Tax=Xylophilus sp. GOD-11R TaxID=3089814 RepID=UPI00298D3E2E|nr:hypothetical protein [Xylophilus sp. GOD-11R]WPB58015.1 hypothetical protein R9X41_05050 [Xylophilus sp. GOD-11R]
MRRLLIVFLMFLLPLQWSWAAAATVCQHERTGSHFGHHEHRHVAATDLHAADQQVDADDQAGADTKTAHPSPGTHPDCHACHGLGSGYPSSYAAPGHTWVAGQQSTAYSHHLPEPPLESFLRPPLPLVA